MLAELLLAERALAEGTPGQREMLANLGIPWKLPAMAEALGVASPSGTLRNLEARRLVSCLAQGRGQGRRVLFIKLSAEAVAVAEYELKYGQSRQQRARWLAKMYGTTEAWQESDASERDRIHREIDAADAERVKRYAYTHIYKKAVLDEENAVFTATLSLKGSDVTPSKRAARQGYPAKDGP